MVEDVGDTVQVRLPGTALWSELGVVQLAPAFLQEAGRVGSRRKGEEPLVGVFRGAGLGLRCSASFEHGSGIVTLWHCGMEVSGVTREGNVSNCARCVACISVRASVCLKQRQYRHRLER